MQAHIKSLHTPSIPGEWPNGQHIFFLLKVVILHFKLKGMEHIAQCKHIVCPYTHPQPVCQVKR